MDSFGVKGFCYDDETGEIVTYTINVETGEPMIYSQPSLDCVQRHESENLPNECDPIKFPSGHICRTQKFQSLKENIIAGSNTLSYRLVLIPTILFCTPIISAILILFEIFLHECCHEKNKHLKDHSMYYRSPFHQVTSVFCGLCRDAESASKVGQLQDKRRKHYVGIRSTEFNFMRNIPAF